MGRIYIDTNRFLDPYRAAHDKFDFFDELQKYKDSLVVTDQTIMEFRRNRVSTLKLLQTEFTKTIKVSPPTTTVLRALPGHKELTELMAAYKKEGNKILEQLEQLIADEAKDPIAQQFLALAADPAVTKLTLTDQVIDRAHRRKLLGNPPRSADKYAVGDEVIWELLIETMKDDLIIVTRDRTFHDNLSLLREEYHQRTGRRLLLVTEKFSEALNQIGEAPTKELTDAEKKEPLRFPRSGWTLEVRTGRAATSKTDSDSGILLATLVAQSSTDPDASGHVWAGGTADDSGVAGHFRVKDEYGEVVFQGDITEPGDGGYLTFDNPIVVEGGTVIIY